VAQHVGVDRKGEACALADALHQAVDGVGRERPGALEDAPARRSSSCSGL
jgi:hypothetical protein